MRKLVLATTFLLGIAAAGTAAATPVSTGSGGGGSGPTPGWNVPGDGMTPTAMQWLTAFQPAALKMDHLVKASSKGTASYRLPLALPPAILGPKLAIAYGSGGGANLEMPYGFAIDGVLEITRPVERAFAAGEWRMGGPHSGLLRAASLYGASRYTPPLPHASALSYRLHTSDGTDVTAMFVALTNTWTVVTSEGLTYELAAADDGAATAAGTARWRATRCSDRLGNTIEFQYDAEHKLSLVRYGGNGATGAAHLVEVAFEYKAAPHTHTWVRNGFVEKFDDVVKQITVKSRKTPAGAFAIATRYKLNSSPRDGVALLDSIDEQGCEDATCTASTTLRRASFQYSTYSPAMAGSGPGPGPGGLGQVSTYTSKASAADFDADVWSIESSRLTDFNGDGLADVVTGGFGSSYCTSCASSDWSVRYQTVDYATGAHSWATTPTYFSGPTAAVSEVDVDDVNKKMRTESQLVDVDGDTLPDVVISRDSLTWEIWYGTGDGFDGPYSETAPWKHSQLAEAGDAKALVTSNVTDSVRSLLDVDGDGWLDCVYPAAGAVYLHQGGRGLGWDAAATPMTTFAAFRSVSYDIEPDPVDSARDRIAETGEEAGFYDLNADGLPDYVQSTSATAWSVSFGNGRGFQAPVSWPAPVDQISRTLEGYPTVVVLLPCSAGDCGFTVDGWDQELLQGLLDVDGDGLLDLVVQGENSRKWYKNLGDGFDTTARTLPSWWPAHLSASSVSTVSEPTGTSGYFSTADNAKNDTVADADHDGMVDASTSSSVHYGTFPKPYLLEVIENGKGGRSDLSYQPSCDVYPAGDSSATQHLASAMSLVREIATTDSVTGESGSTEYTYSSGLHEDGVFQGFHVRNARHEKNGALLAEVQEVFQLDAALDPLLVLSTSKYPACRDFAPSLVRTCASPTKQRSQMFTTWSDVGPHRSATSVDVWEYGEVATAAAYHHVDYQYDQDGDVLLVSHDGGGDAHDAIQRAFEYTAAPGLLRLASEVVTGYDPLNAVVRPIAATRYLYDGHTDPLAAPGSGVLTGVRVAAGDHDAGEALEAKVLQWTLGHGPRGELLTVLEHATGALTTRGYGFGAAVKTSEIDAVGHQSQFTLDTRGRVTEARDLSNGTADITQYDGLGRVLTLDRQDATGALARVSSKLYGTAIPSYTRTRLHDAAGVVEGVSYVVEDGFGATAQIWAQTEAGGFQVTDVIHDVLGNETRRSHPYARSLFSYTGLAGTSVLTRSYFDEQGVLRETHRDEAAGIGPAVTYLDAPRSSKKVDEAGFATLLDFDAHHRIKRVSIGKQGQDVLPVRAQYEYDPMNHLVRFVDARGNQYKYSYDAAGRLRRANGPDIGTTTSNYLGYRKTSQVDAAGLQATWSYDAIGRPLTLSMTDPLEGDGIADYTWSYDTAWVGKVWKTTDPSGSTTYLYDDRGRESDVRRESPSFAAPVVFQYAHDNQDRITHKTLPSAAAVTSSYSHGWLAAIDDGAGASTLFDYDAHGQLASWQSSLGHQVSWTRTTPLWAASVALGFGATSFGRAYSYLENGLLATSTTAGTVRTFAYDADRRLISVVKAPTGTEESFTHDAAGNLMSAREPGGTVWTYGAAGAAGFPGNRTGFRNAGARRQDFTYDAAGRLVTIADTLPGAGRQYQYDGLGRLRAVRKAGALVLTIERDSDGGITRRGTPSGTIDTFRDWRRENATGRVVEKLAEHVANDGGARRWLLAEADGHVAVVLNDAGAQTSGRVLGAYGLPVALVGSPWELDALDGEEIEPGQDLFAMGARHLLRRDGQWLQPEPLLYLGIPQTSLEDPQGLATYRYARNTPTSYSDRQGMAPLGPMQFDHLPSAEEVKDAQQALRDDMAKTFADHPDKVITKVPTVAKTVLKAAKLAGPSAGVSPVATQVLKKATGGMTAEIPGMGIISKTGDIAVAFGDAAKEMSYFFDGTGSNYAVQAATDNALHELGTAYQAVPGGCLYDYMQ